MADGGVAAVERRVFEHVLRHGLLDRGDGVLLMLSGGPDSMAMLALVRAFDRRYSRRLRLAALHVDYGTRGAASRRDRQIVERATGHAGIALTVVEAAGRLPAHNFQEEARRVRWEAARRLADESGYTRIAVGHNLDDRAETVLYRLVKYGAPGALAAMPPRDDRVVRPLLCLRADEVRDYCVRRNVESGDDETNRGEGYARNTIRLSVLPHLRRLNPRAAESIAAAADTAVEEQALLDGLVEEAWPELLMETAGPDGPPERALDLGRLSALAPGLRALVLRRFVKEAVGAGRLLDRRTTAALRRLADGSGGTAAVTLRDGWEAVREYDRLFVHRQSPRHVCDPVVVCVPAAGSGAGEVGFCGKRLLVEQVVGDADVSSAPVVLASARPVARLTLRHPIAGERFRPLGHPADTLIARFLREQKTPAPLRTRALVVEADGAVAWVGLPCRQSPDGAPAVGWLRGRVAHGFRVTDSTPYTVRLRPADDAGSQGRTAAPRTGTRGERPAGGEDRTT